MKTTELFVEQVLIGLVALAVVALIAFPEAMKDLLLTDADGGLSFDKLVGGAAVLAVAYLVGIVYDRFADTLFQDLEQHHRLELGTTEESRLRLNILHQGGEVAAYSDYLRSRLRLTRSIATLLPALAVAWALFDTPAARKQAGDPWLLLGIYAILFLWKLCGWQPRVPRDRTETEAVWRYKTSRIWVEKGDRGWKRARARLALMVREPLTWGLLLVTWLAVRVGTSEAYLDRWILPVLAAAGALLTTWTWWRIGQTDARLLKDYTEFHCSKEPTPDS